MYTATYKWSYELDGEHIASGATLEELIENAKFEDDDEVTADDNYLYRDGEAFGVIEYIETDDDDPCTVKVKFDTEEEAQFFLEHTRTFMEQHIDWDMEFDHDMPLPNYDEELVIDFREQ